MRVSPAAEARLPHETRFVAATPDRARLALAARDGRYTIVDAALRPVAQGRLPVPAGAIALHPGGELLAVASRSALALVDRSGACVRTWEHRGWEEWEGGAVAFVDGGARLLGVVADEDGAAAVVARVDTGEVLEERPLAVPEPAGFVLVASPAPGTWALWAGAGQDGQWTYRLRLERDELRIDELTALSGKDHGPPAFSASGEELAVDAEDGIERYDAGTLRLLARVEPSTDALAAERPVFVGPRRVLVTDRRSSTLHVLAVEEGWREEDVIVVGHEPRPFAELHPALAQRGDDPDLCSDLWLLEGLPGGAALLVFGDPGQPQTLALLEGPPLFEVR